MQILQNCCSTAHHGFDETCRNYVFTLGPQPVQNYGKPPIGTLPSGQFDHTKHNSAFSAIQARSYAKNRSLFFSRVRSKVSIVGQKMSHNFVFPRLWQEVALLSMVRNVEIGLQGAGTAHIRRPTVKATAKRIGKPAMVQECWPLDFVSTRAVANNFRFQMDAIGQESLVFHKVHLSTQLQLHLKGDRHQVLLQRVKSSTSVSTGKQH